MQKVKGEGGTRFPKFLNCLKPLFTFLTKQINSSPIKLDFTKNIKSP